MTYVIYGVDEFTDVFNASTIYPRSNDEYGSSKHNTDCVTIHNYVRTRISTSSPECNHRSRAQQKSLLNAWGCLCDPGEGNAFRLFGEVGGEATRASWGTGDDRAEMFALEEELSDWRRSGSLSNGFSSSNASIMTICAGETRTVRV